jgi:hypothetical protein
MSTTNHPDQPPSRLDQEISEILEEARNRPISFQDKVAQRRAAIQTQKQSTVQTARASVAGSARTASDWLLRVPLVTALVVALIAVWIEPNLPFVAVVLGLVAVGLIFLPFVRKRPDDGMLYQKRWRGRVIDQPRAPSGSMRHWIDAARDRLQR